VDHAKAIGQAEQAFRVADEEMAVGIQAAIKLFNQSFLFRFVEIDHDIATEDEIVTLREELRL
jgi:hypothetical protein